MTDTRLPFALGIKGRYRDKSFEVAGRVQLQNSSGARWDEWYLSFEGAVGQWLARAAGRFFLSSVVEGRGRGPWPEYLSLSLNTSPIDGFCLVDKGIATCLHASGELPCPFTVGGSHPYADLEGPGFSFATLDYEDSPPRLYAGREVFLPELGAPPVTETSVVSLCPTCHGPVSIHAPDETQSVVCPLCHGLHYRSDTGLAPTGVTVNPRPWPTIPPGSMCLFEEGDALTAVGFIQRASDEGERWDEYVLYHPNVGFRWLSCARGHWTYLWPLGAGDVPASVRSRAMRGAVNSHITHFSGEAPWRLSLGETSRVYEHPRAPAVFALELSESEARWTQGVYLRAGEITVIPGVSQPRRPRGEAPHRPLSLRGYSGVKTLRAMIKRRHRASSHKDFSMLLSPHVTVGGTPCNSVRSSTR